MAKVFIGTSGFSYPHWKTVFYPPELHQSEWLRYYAKYFDTVELNVSFYRLPQKKTFESWRKTAGLDFVFAVKGSRFITHVKRLKDCREPVRLFFKEAVGLGEPEKAVILWQLPPRWQVNAERLDLFLKILPSDYRHAFEFRDDSWLNSQVFALLSKSQVAVVFQDFSGWPITDRVTADFVYLRFHGRDKLYSSNYSKKELEGWAKKIRGWKKRGLAVYAYFNNDAMGYAVENARDFKKMVGD